MAKNILYLFFFSLYFFLVFCILRLFKTNKASSSKTSRAFNNILSLVIKKGSRSFYEGTLRISLSDVYILARETRVSISRVTLKEIITKSIINKAENYVLANVTMYPYR